MNIIVLAHPEFVRSRSMSRFANMLATEYQRLGHTVQVWKPKPHFYSSSVKWRSSKWAGYVDQFLLFPFWLRRMIAKQSTDTIYVLSDQALGPWMPIIRHLPHAVHTHDLLALRSALGEFPENPTRWSGRIYQRYIRRGFRSARQFICISQKTKDDLQKYGQIGSANADVVYNGLSYPYARMPETSAGSTLKQANLDPPAEGMILHVSSGSWYKNLPGVIKLYANYAKRSRSPLPLWLVGGAANTGVDAAMREVPNSATVKFLNDISDETLCAAYSLARAFLFPSLEEGFGWPIIEAQACGCAVITTDAPPMNEIGGPVAKYLPRLNSNADATAWATIGADVLEKTLSTNDANRMSLSAHAIAWASKFDASEAINAYLRIYERVLSEQRS